MNLQGSETGSITLCFCILLLAIHQDIQVSKQVIILKGRNSFTY